MKEAKKFLYSDKVVLSKEARDGKFNDPFGPGIFTFVQTTTEHLDKALEIAYLQGKLELMSPGWEDAKIIKRFEELTGINWGKTYWMD